MKLFNTLSGAKETLEKSDNRPLKLFVCGPTVYDYPHIGNARTFLFFDIFARYLRSQGYKLTYLQNITDIDDKIILRAKEDSVGWNLISRKFEKAYLENMRSLGVDSVDMYAKATDYIAEIVSQVKTLIAKGNAYLIEDDGYYFDLKTFPEYGKLSRRTVEQAEDAVTRIDTSDKKRNRGDFSLWKLSSTDEPGWNTELGFGRPGWHIEDTAITEHFFGPQYDIHGGALDLKFPHHEAEIAQQESASGLKPFVKHWIHAGFLTVDGQKMSKSLGNFVTIHAFLKDNPPELFRMMVFMHHYRSPLDYTENLIAIAKKNLSDIGAFVRKLELARGEDGGNYAEEFKAKFEEAMDDDLNTPNALAAVFETMNIVAPKIYGLSKKSGKSLKTALVAAFGSVGIDLPSPRIPFKIRLLARKRDKYRSSKQFIQSDALRDKAYALGYTIEDTPQGPFIWVRD
ncbi:MAG: cysteinyl-tRNA synthetase [Parcubacteria group bacterium LiPW_15]|nr:MAG: cysteinyl-tRNA synthetase [Parcubacteria group bacterium LiPW_15]